MDRLYRAYGFKIFGANAQYVEAEFVNLTPSQIAYLEASGWTVERIQ